MRSSRRSPTPQPCSRLICERSSMSKRSERQRMLVAERALDFLRHRELEDRRRDQRRQRVADADRDFAAGNLLGVGAEDLERGAADRVGDERPRLGGGAEPIVERDFVEDDALGVMDGVEQLARGERRAVAREVAHRGGLGVERAGVHARREEPQEQFRAPVQFAGLERRRRGRRFARRRRRPAPPAAHGSARWSGCGRRRHGGRSLPSQVETS